MKKIVYNLLRIYRWTRFTNDTTSPSSIPHPSYTTIHRSDQSSVLLSHWNTTVVGNPKTSPFSMMADPSMSTAEEVELLVTIFNQKHQAFQLSLEIPGITKVSFLPVWDSPTWLTALATTTSYETRQHLDCGAEDMCFRGSYNTGIHIEICTAAS